jgi:hypothetical protein
VELQLMTGAGTMAISFRHRIVAMALAALALATTAGCGRIDGRHPVDAVATDPAGTEQIRSQAVALYERWAGSIEDRQAAEVVIAQELNGARAECMESKGYTDVPWELAIGSAPPVDPPASSGWLMKPMSGFYSDTLLAGAWSDRARLLMQRPLPPVENQASLDCDKVIPQAGDDEIDQIRHPAAATELDSAWRKALTETVSYLGDTEDYLTCLDRAAIPALQGRPVSELDDVFDQARPAPNEIPLPGEQPSPAWEAFRGLESGLTVADWGCREHVYGAGMQKLPAMLSQFQTSHASEVTSLEQHWSQIRVRAAELGWTPSKPHGNFELPPGQPPESPR